MTLALFDFDGTITTHDSLIEFIKFAVGTPRYYIGLALLSPMLIQYKLKLLPNNLAKERLISHYFKGLKEEEFLKTAHTYSETKINDIIRPLALEKISWHQNNGHKVVLVSASIKDWLEPWCKEHNMDLISTQLEVSNQRITGKFSTKNCYGIEKENRIRQKYNLKEYSSIYAYGDSSGDTELLALADHKHYKPFRQ